MSVELDKEMMHRCLDLARKAAGRTAPNPMVGAVLLDRDGKIVGEGFHAAAGQAHAEVNAFEDAAGKGEGGTLYVNLEPCSHFGRTPPCADLVLSSKVARVVVGIEDPNPQVAGTGIKKLRDAGIKVDLSELTNECRELNRAFFKHISSGMPWLTLKMAASLDGRIADRHGKSRWISGPEARHYVQCLRNTYDCVLIGGKTAVLDDPELNVREIQNGRDPHRAVVDPALKLSPQARLCKHKDGSKSWTVIFYDSSLAPQIPEFPESVKLIDLAEHAEPGRRLEEALRWLGSQGVLSVLCEGGGRMAASLLNARLVDELAWIIAPKVFSDSEAIPALAGTLFVPVDDCLQLLDPTYTQLGSDMLVTGKLRKNQ